jgi:tight adherence protein C
MLVIQAVVFGLFVGGFIIFVGFFIQQRSQFVRRRLQGDSRPKAELLRPQSEEKPSFLSADLVASIERKLNLGKNSTRIKEFQKRLIQAGIYNERAPSIFYGFKMGLLSVLPLMIMFFWWGQTGHRGMLIAVVCAVFFVGYMLPDIILDKLIKSRQNKIRAALPDTLDLLVVCVEAGQGLNAAIKRVSDDLMESSPIIAKELLMVNLEIMAGLERELALKNLGERTGVDDLISLCNILIQSDRFGTSIGQALRTQSDFMRTARQKKLEELAAKTPVKLVFPLLLFIFPAIMVVVLGPAVIRISAFFSHTIH